MLCSEKCDLLCYLNCYVFVCGCNENRSEKDHRRNRFIYGSYSLRSYRQSWKQETKGEGRCCPGLLSVSETWGSKERWGLRYCILHFFSTFGVIAKTIATFTLVTKFGDMHFELKNRRCLWMPTSRSPIPSKVRDQVLQINYWVFTWVYLSRFCLS
jgi:hypothetical protein